MDTFSGAVDSLQGSIETLQIQALTPLMEDRLRPLVQEVTAVINSITDWAVANPEAAQTVILITGVVTAFGAALAALGLVVGFIGKGIAALAVVIGALFTPIGVIIGAVAALGAAFATNFLGIRDRVYEVVNSIQALRREIDLLALLPGPAFQIFNAYGAVEQQAQQQQQQQGSAFFGTGLMGGAATQPYRGQTRGGGGGAVMMRAGGGMMSAGMPYMVGERGPELVIPDRSSYVMANHTLGGANVNITLNVTEGNARNAGMNFAIGLQERMRAMG
jgi:hypothetical protein